MNTAINITRPILNRENGHTSLPGSFEDNLYIGDAFLSRLNLETELTGHTGCVNCLSWSKNGDILGSGSDDTKVIIWDALRHKLLTSLDTPHQGNIFSVVFLPNSSNSIIASGAADGNVFVHDIQRKKVVASFNMEARVKRIASSELFHSLIFSASEDGIIREFDLREPSRPTQSNVFIDLTTECGKSIECKCVTVNPRNPNLMAVGCNDPYLRLYDIRKIKLNNRKLFEGCVSYFNPAHIQDKRRLENTYRNFCVTYATFDSKGREILVNLGGEQIYLFDIYNFKEPLSFNTRNCFYNNSPTNSKAPCGNFGAINVRNEGLVERYKNKGNELFAQKEYCSAINLYNKANCLYPTSVIYGNRAAAYIRRAWEGDCYAALRDCNSALQCDPSYVKAHYRFARCLCELGWLEDAEKCLNQFKKRHPEHANNSTCNSLMAEIQKKLQKKKSSADSNFDDRISFLETKLRAQSSDYKQRYCGHCNTTTDIKEANFLGPSEQYIIAGSDEGSFFIWEKETSNLVRVMKADSSIVNCVQPHPNTCLLATSGIDYCIRLWSPIGEEDKSKIIEDTNSVSGANQQRMRCNPLDSMLMSMGMPFISQEDNTGTSVGACQPS